MTEYNVAVIVGSIAKESINRKLFGALNALAAEAKLKFTEVPINDLPLYSYDYDADYPAVGTALKEGISGADAVLIVTPEYNRSMPGALKNAFDWASRPWGTNSFNGKPVGVIGTSPGAMSTALAQRDVRAVLSFLNAPAMLQPEGYLQDTPGLITAEGEITNEGTAEFLASWLAAFHTHIERTLG